MAAPPLAEPVGFRAERYRTGGSPRREDLLGIYRYMLITRGIEERGDILYSIYRSPAVLHGPREPGRGSRRRHGDGPERRRHSATATWAPTSPAVRAGRSSRSTWAARGAERGRDGNAHMAVPELGPHTMVSHFPRCCPCLSALLRVQDP